MPVRKNMKNNLIPPSPVKVVLLEEEKEAQMKQGIVTILGSDFCHGNKSGAASIRRTLSADMSSKKWLQQNGFFSPIKNISSSSPPSPSSSSSSSSSSEGEEENEENPGQDDVWRKIQEQKQRDDDDDDEKKKKPLLKMDVWGTMILTNKSENSAVLAAAAAAAPPLPPPYVHPLVKRSASTLSEKSLEICTESLGSETGSDCFSADIVEDQERAHVMPVAVVVGDSNNYAYADVHVAKYKKSPTRPFPPPLPSITGGDGAALHVQSHRENGRLVLEAVSVPQRNHFHAQRCDGRLVLTLVHAPPSSELMVEEMFDNMEEVDEDVTDDEAEVTEAAAEAEENIFQAQSVRKEKEYMVEQNLSLPSGIMSLNKSPMVIKKLMAVGNMNMSHSKWSQNLNKVAEEEIPIPHSLPPPPRVARLIPAAAAAAPPAAASFNAYEYFWRNKTADGTHLKNKNTDGGGGGAKGCENEEMVVVKVKKTEYSVPYIRGCKEARRSMSIWEPYCIATS